MNCRECELLLASEDPRAAGEHLAVCESCRGFAEDLRANAEALRSFSADPLPRLRTTPAKPALARWAIAAVAVVALGLGLRAWVRPALVLELPPVRVAAAPSIAQSRRILPARHRKHAKPPATLTVKMLTPDPDVVIYWIVETKEGMQ